MGHGCVHTYMISLYARTKYQATYATVYKLSHSLSSRQVVKNKKNCVPNKKINKKTTYLFSTRTVQFAGCNLASISEEKTKMSIRQIQFGGHFFKNLYFFKKKSIQFYCIFNNFRQKRLSLSKTEKSDEFGGI